MSDTKRTPDQLRATHAWEAVELVLKKFPPSTVTESGKPLKRPHPQAKKFGGAVRKLPVRIMASGLGQALAFLKAKDQTPDLLDTLSDWVLKKRSQTALLEAVIAGTADTLRQHTAETLAYLQWLSRFCEANNLTDDDNAGGG
ncbi:type III-B CRISPR module-associated protein Cmr5 [Gemmata sp. JC673]|uniref:CRISPR type III-B/RAMP module-associated protein Cmr5 n=1 Tax=Gemmata algarum TaxID=2975278 RepID=A0ABU5F787_9BACT|nr:type III-B CRISPR module-associated protein Cmr5 [Gemmata algarum]MDY3562988.1 type III-B CRISPR module-associated protein Cmr5 [Gemmata algarum]